MKKALIEKRKVMLNLLPNAHSCTSLCSFPWYQGKSGSYWYTWPHVDLAEREESEPTRYFRATVVYVSKEKHDLSNVSNSLFGLLRIGQASQVDVNEAMNTLVPEEPLVQEGNFFYKRINPDGLLMVRQGKPRGNHFYLVNKIPEEARSL